MSNRMKRGMSMGFTKLDSGILDSSIWNEPVSVRVVWVAFLAKSNMNGVVRVCYDNMLRVCNVTKKEFDHALSVLESPDVNSRSPEYDGRRIERMDGGWFILNYLKYRQYTYSDSPDAVRKRRSRGQGVTCPKVAESVLGHSASASASVLNSLSSLEEKEYEKEKPFLKDVTEYCKQRGNKIDPELFWNHYQARGWKIHGDLIVDWRALILKWEKNDAAKEYLKKGYGNRLETEEEQDRRMTEACK